ncbi:probable membrane-associated kinase regulator 4 [Phalaenopsis equestris]|uniref:probable membrane-associated kinase regulator 4 n=1 Tax=Phalaenopsis equestris TaxID=78828 RepID=UPI0009E602FB|nr:probable membrane-associated kinase regulator 4 [Phalaenopsis equestris]
MASGSSSSCDHSVEEEYIDMDMSSTSFFCCRVSSPNNREFEFHLSANPISHIETTISSADELFYKGKLLPLHFSQRFEMIEKSHENSETVYSFKALSSIATEREASCSGSCELNRNCAVKSDKKKSGHKRIRIIKQFLLKVPKAYLKFLINKTRRLESNMANKEGKSNNGAVMQSSIDREELTDGCMQRNSPQMLKKSSSMNSEMENSILGAIAYCKMSQQVCSRKGL